MKKIIRLTESDLTRIVKRVINEESMDCSKLKVIPKSGIKGLNTNGKPQSPTWNEDIRKIGNATTVYFFEGSKVDAINTQRKCYRAKKEVTYLEFKRNDGTSYVMIGVD